MAPKTGDRKRKWLLKILTRKENTSWDRRPEKKMDPNFVDQTKISGHQIWETFYFLVTNIWSHVLFRPPILGAILFNFSGHHFSETFSFPVTRFGSHFLFQSPVLRANFFSGHQFWEPFSFLVTNIGRECFIKNFRNIEIEKYIFTPRFCHLSYVDQPPKLHIIKQ